LRGAGRRGGPFDAITRSYLDNIVVFASLTATSRS